MGNEEQVTDTTQSGTDSTAAEAAATATVETAVEQTEEEKQEAGKVSETKAAKVEEESTYKKINKTIKELKTETRKTKEALHQEELKRVAAETELRVLKEMGGKVGDRPAKADPIEAAYAKQNPEPQVDEFETQEDYLKAVRGWDRGLVRFELEQAGKTTQETARQAEQRKATETLSQALESQRTKGEEKYEDFEEVVGDVEFDGAALSAMAASEIGEDIAYYLASNPKEKARIDGLNPILQAKEIGRIETGLESGKIQIKKVTSAPPPAKTVPGNANPKTDWSKKGDDEWYKAKRQEKLNSA